MSHDTVSFCRPRVKSHEVIGQTVFIKFETTTLKEKGELKQVQIHENVSSDSC